MENIVTGQQSDTRLQETEDRPNIPRGTQQGTEQGLSGNSVPVPSDFPTMGTSQLDGGQQLATQTISGLSEQGQQQPTQLGQQSQLGTSGLAPWLADPNTQLVLPDIPNYLNQLRQQSQIQEPMPQQSIRPMAPVFRTQEYNLASPDYVGRYRQNYEEQRQAATFRDSLQTKLGISDYLTENGVRSPVDRSGPNGTSIPSSLNNVPSGLYRNFNGGVSLENPTSIVGNLIEQGGAVINLAGAAATDLWNNFWTLDPMQRQESTPFTNEAWGNFVQTIVSPDDPSTTEADQLFSPSRGFFGEQGRGWLGAANYFIFSPAQQGLMASLYSATDLGRAVQQAIEVRDGRINVNPANVRTEEFNNRPFHRFQQALEGRDLSFTNVRVPGDDRYFALIPQNVPESEQLGYGILGFTLDLLTGGVVDNLTDGAVATTRVSAARLGRGEVAQALNIPQNWSIAQRINRIGEIRRSRANIPAFTTEPPSVPRLEGSTPEVSQPTTTATVGNVAQTTAEQTQIQQIEPSLTLPPEVATPAEINRAISINETSDLAENVYLVPEQSIINANGLDFAETLARYPESGIFLPEVQIRTPDQITNFAQSLGIEDLPQMSVIRQVGYLQENYGNTFDWVGVPLPDAPRVTQLDEALDVAEEIPSTERWAAKTRQFNDIEIEDSLVDAVVAQEPPARIQRWIDWIEANPETPLRYDRWLHGTELADRLLVEANTLRTFERNIAGLRHAVEESQLAAPPGWGHIADEIQTKAAHLKLFDEGTQIRELYDEQPANPSYLFTDRPYYHGTRQADSIFRVNFKEGAAHEYGTGLYLTVDPDYANIAARSQRTPHNPIPGTTRINPTGGFIHKIEPEISGGVLELDDPLPDDIRELFKRAAREVYDERTAHIYERDLRSIPARNAWLKLRDVYSNLKRVQTPELSYRRFSNRISDLLNQAGYRGLRDERRGVFVQLPDLSGRIRGNVVSSTPVPTASRTQSLYSRHWMNAEMAKHFEDGLAEGYERQSRTQLLHSVLQDYVSQYERVRSQYGRTADDFAGFLNYQDELVLDRANRTIDEVRQNIESLADETPEYKEFRTVAPDWECM